ncbi:MAG TPA: hypothetical protein VLW55_01740, partial [Burkholderiaceae bacterium]|nr:hypothetical protein [Burkholderiaceae bacterium]
MMRQQALPLVCFMVAVLAPLAAFGADPPATHITRVAAVAGPLSADAKCTGAPPSVLVGPGAFEIAVPATDLSEAAKYAAGSPGDDRRVFINGIDVTSSIDPLLGPKSNDATCAFLRYRLKPGVDSQKLWSAVYRQVGLTGETKAAFQLGWKSTGPNSITEKDAGDTRIAVSSQTLVAAATVSLLALVGFFLWLYQRSDVFRDPPPDWLALARTQEKQYVTAPDDAAR